MQYAVTCTLPLLLPLSAHAQLQPFTLTQTEGPTGGPTRTIRTTQAANGSRAAYQESPGSEPTVPSLRTVTLPDDGKRFLVNDESKLISTYYLSPHEITALKTPKSSPVCDPGSGVYVAGIPPIDYEGHQQSGRAFSGGFPDLYHAIDDHIVEEDKVVVRLALRGTQTGDFMGIPPTNKPVTVGANIVSRSTSRGSSRLEPRSMYSVCVSRDISFRCGPVMRPPSLQMALIILSSSSTTMKSSSVSLVERKNSESVSFVAPPAGWRNVPEIGFIVTTPPCDDTWASGLAPIGRTEGSRG